MLRTKRTTPDIYLLGVTETRAKFYKNKGNAMNNKYIGIALIIVGVVAAFWGYNVYDSAGSQVSRALSGDAPIEAWAGMIGGIVCVAVGIYKIK